MNSIQNYGIVNYQVGFRRKKPASTPLARKFQHQMTACRRLRNHSLLPSSAVEYVKKSTRKLKIELNRILKKSQNEKYITSTSERNHEIVINRDQNIDESNEGILNVRRFPRVIS